MGNLSSSMVLKNTRWYNRSSGPILNSPFLGNLPLIGRRWQVKKSWGRAYQQSSKGISQWEKGVNVCEASMLLFLHVIHKLVIASSICSASGLIRSASSSWQGLWSPKLRHRVSKHTILYVPSIRCCITISYVLTYDIAIYDIVCQNIWYRMSTSLLYDIVCPTYDIICWQESRCTVLHEMRNGSDIISIMSIISIITIGMI